MPGSPIQLPLRIKRLEQIRNEFKIPEIIFDPTLDLSPHVCFLGMLSHIKGFKTISRTGPVLDCPENLYNLRVVDDNGQQELKLKDELQDKSVFCQVAREATGYRIALDKQLTASTVRSRMREQVTKPYSLRYAGAKAFNSSAAPSTKDYRIASHSSFYPGAFSVIAPEKLKPQVDFWAGWCAHTRMSRWT